MPANASASKAGRENSRWNRFLTQLCNFFNNTSVHGVKYLSEHRRPHPERILWFLSIILSMIFCAYLISKSWAVRSSSPVILAMDKKQLSVRNIPFPAITICPTDIVRPMNNLKKQERNDMHCALNLICEREFDTEGCNNSYKIIQSLVTNAPKLEEIFVSTPHYSTAVFLGRGNEVARPLLTTGGLCYTINMLPGSAVFANNTFHKSENYLDYNEIVNWHIDEGYMKKEPSSSSKRYPRPALGAGEESGLLMLLKNEAVFNESKSCTFIHGYQVQVHNPVDFPSGDQKYYAPLNNMVKVFVTPEVLITDNLRSYTPEQRQCYYSDERKLEFFNIYSQANCELECLSAVSLKKCKCVAYYLPRHKDTPVCVTDDQRDCADNQKGMSEDQTHHGETEVQCNCLPSCSHVRYRFHAVHTNVDKEELETIYKTTYRVSEVEDCDFTIIQVFLTESLFIPFRRLELYGTVEFLANCGGVLGLCLGVSVLSIIELLYWMLVRPFCQPPPVRDAPTDVESANLTPL